ncbi:ECF transporter S component [Spiroplasma endosymbiont of Labia minor]|uniref:ECF transporter S component n=1 Tax=Spiroplasma endosymbiont of Labia minor TaxID=3066305 RepID=UPI0030D0E397
MQENQQNQGLLDDAIVNTSQNDINQHNLKRINFLKFHFSIKWSIFDITIISMFCALAVLFQFINNLLVTIIYPFNINLSFLPIILFSYYKGWLKSFMLTIVATIISYLIWPPFLVVWQMFLINGILLPFIPTLFGFIFSIRNSIKLKKQYYCKMTISFSLIFIAMWICNTIGLASYFIILYPDSNQTAINEWNTTFKNLKLNVWNFAALYTFFNYLFGYIIYFSLSIGLCKLLQMLAKRYN